MKESPVKNRQEHEANYFAMCLLIPERMLRKTIEDLGMEEFSDQNIKTLANLFEVEHTVMMARLIQLRIVRILGA